MILYPMMSIRPLLRFITVITVAVLAAGIAACSSPGLKPWHTVELNEEFTVDMVTAEQVQTFADYLALEERLFRQLEEEIYANSETGPSHALERYSKGSAADPEHRQHNWNHSFELTHPAPVGGVLLLHGMSDSPYSMRTLAYALNQQGYHVIALRSPGHGTVPSGLRSISWQDMAAAVGLAMKHLSTELDGRPVHMIGYSAGASLALNHTLDALEQQAVPPPASVVLISPAIRVHPASAMAGFKNSLSALPGMDGMAYVSLMDEFDPYKYNSFATNAAAQMHRLTHHVDGRIRSLASDPAVAGNLPPLLAIKSTVDATVTTDAVVDNLLIRLPANRNELLLFDINRHAAIKSTLLVDDPGPLTERLLNDAGLPFAVTMVKNKDVYSRHVVARRKPAYSEDGYVVEPLQLEWPAGVVSLSHVALPFPPDDPVYGESPVEDNDQVFLGNLAIKGERGLLKIPGEWLLRLRYNPFYDYMQMRIVEWLNEAGAAHGELRQGTARQ